MDVKKVLIVSSDVKAVEGLISIIGEDKAQFEFVDQASFAIKSIQTRPYNVIVLGDSLGTRGDTYDVGLEIKRSAKNKHTPIICIGHNKSKAAKLLGLLKPYALRADPNDVQAYADQIKTWFKVVDKKAS